MYTLKYAQVQLRMPIYTLIQLLPHVSFTLWRELWNSPEDRNEELLFANYHINYAPVSWLSN